MIQRISVITEQKSFIPFLLVLTGLSLLAAAFGADVMGFSDPGVSSSQISLALGGMAITLAGAILVTSARARRLLEWLMVGATALAVAFAADLVVFGGLPGTGSKQFALATALLGAISLSSIPLLQENERYSNLLRAIRSIDRAEIIQFASVVFQLGLLVLLMRQYELESQAFYYSVMLVTFYGFLIHFFLPLQYRLPFFLFLSLATFFGVLGITNGFWLVGTGLALIALCQLPIRISLRITLLLGIGALLVLARAALIPSPWPTTIWPILGSLFMFRLIIYLYDRHHTKKPISPWQTLSYFFLLPNLVFPFFPVVDFATFRRTYFNENRYQIYQQGLQWMLRGVFQLVLYRFINYYVVIAVEDVSSTVDVARYAIANFALYVRVSGQFHLVIGLLHMFGFNLPETNHRYFLASGFVDLWRRINIYWKEFMLKVVFYPAYFRLAKMDTIARLAAATAVVFFVTWFLHAYQWFWLRGAFLLTGPDVFFWALLALLVIYSTIREAKRGRKRSLSVQTLTLRELAGRAVRTAGTFSLITVLWSLWNSPSIADWVSLWLTAASLEGIATLIAIFAGITVLMAIAILITGDGVRARRQNQESNKAFFRAAALNVLGGGLMLIITIPAIQNAVGGQVADVVRDLQVTRLSNRDAELLQRGYYEDLIGVNQFNSELWQIYSKRPSDWPRIQDTSAAQMTGDVRVLQLVPNQQISFHGATFSTNSWGMRDREYDLVPPAGTYRAVLLGPSYVMGSGVHDDEVFEWRLEDRLNEENAGDSSRRYEILNMAMAGYSAIQELYVLEREAVRFRPSAIYYVAHQLEQEIIVRNLAATVVGGIEIPYPFFEEMAREAGVEPGMSQAEAERRLQPHAREMLIWVYQRMAAIAREKNADFVWVFIPAIETRYDDEDVRLLTEMAAEVGFEVIDLSDVYDGYKEEAITVAEWDKHPNARGHQLIADRLYTELREKKLVRKDASD